MRISSLYHCTRSFLIYLVLSYFARSFASMQQRILENMKRHKDSDTEHMRVIKDRQIMRTESQLLRRRARRLSFIDMVNLNGHLSRAKAALLDMDHIFIKFADFLWA